MFDDFKAWIKTPKGILAYDALTYGWILGIITAIAAFKCGMLR